MGIQLEQSLKNRESIIDGVREEMIGPSTIMEHWHEFNPIGNAIVPKMDAPLYWKKGGLKEEILQFQTPTQRYVSGLLFPLGISENEMESLETLLLDKEKEEDAATSKEEDVSFHADDEESITEEEGEMELLPQKNDYMPSSMGITFCLDKDVETIHVNVTGGTYDPQNIRVEDKDKNSTLWLRSSLRGGEDVDIATALKQGTLIRDVRMYDATSQEVNRFKMQIQIVIRDVGGKYITTISLTNRSEKAIGQNESNETYHRKEQLILFQAMMEVCVKEGHGFSTYPSRYDLTSKKIPDSELESEELSMELLYRKNGNYAFGHGCSVHWDQNVESVTSLKTTFLPEYQAMSMTPDIQVMVDGKMVELKILMADLAGITANRNPKKILESLIKGYQNWIISKERELDLIPAHLKPVAKKHLKLCTESHDRMLKGLDILEEPQALKAFQLANLAILLQQRNGKEKRDGVIDKSSLVFDEEIDVEKNSLHRLAESDNSWRAFQIAFILMSLDSFVNETGESRNIVDLIWFPTGGGKTEAYLGVAAFQMIYRRLENPDDAGVDVIMRYTLRLLTADQFQRSSRLMCALEYIRRRHEKNLGKIPFSIGIWVGSATTPNRNKDAIKQLNKLQGRNKKDNQFIVNNCPWCGAKMGYYNDKMNKGNPQYQGFKNEENSLILYCPDRNCEFSESLPIYIVDETIYKKRPTFLIGTVDKFVQLVWEPEARSLFGLDGNGERIYSPPSLIVQDELHLISGPLGTLTGLFEVLIEELCLKYIDGRVVKPKIIAATATIKQYEEQTKALFGRPVARLFPSPGLESEDSFFATPALDAIGKPMPGRKYVGVYTTTVRIMMSQVMTFSSIIQSVKDIDPLERDPYWTLLAFYNTLRELGGGLTLTQMDISQYSNAMSKRKGKKGSLRYLNNVLELTSRKQSHEISKAIDDLKTGYKEPVKSTGRKRETKQTIDMCLASNIIEVGVDIDRLSVMAIVGQPKMTAQYIQVSGRVGRKWWERPGLIFTLYSNTKSRDKSHFEHFREYHEKLYAQVEPTSVTPFSDASLEKGLTAVLVGYLRQALSKDLGRAPSSESIKKHQGNIQTFLRRIIERAEMVDPEQVPVLKDKLNEIIKELLFTPFSTWEVKGDDTAYMYRAGMVVSRTIESESVPMINSLRNVDSECRGMISSLYNKLPSNDEDVDGWEFLK